MNQVLLALIFLVLLSGCKESSQPKTPEMEAEARSVIVEYLAKNNLPNEPLVLFKSSAKPMPDFSYLYTGGGRCIEFIVLCNGQSCKELRKYPYDEHGEQCP